MIFYICGCFYVVFGLHTIAANVKSNVNRLFVTLTSSMAIWSFAYSISTSAPTAEASAFWQCFSVFGWGVFYSILLHFVLILTRFESRLPKRTMFALIYTPALINVILFAPFGFLAENQYRMVQTDLGWVNIHPLDVWGIWYIVYYAVFSVASITLLIYWWIHIESHTLLKRRVTFFLLSVLFSFFLGIATETLPDIFGKNFSPRFIIIFMMIPVATLFLTSKKMDLILERKTVASLFSATKQPQDMDRSRLFQTATAIYTLGSVISFSIGYYGMGKPLNGELLLAGFLLLTGLMARLIPSLTKSRSIQNTLFLVINMVGMVFFMISNADTGAVTAWATYIIFLLFTVILDSKIHAGIFVVFVIVLQIIYSMIYPEISVTVDKSEYVTRIFIVVLSAIAVRRLTTEYALKIEAYKKYAREQEVLEQISSSFISVDKENIREKIDELFEMSAEILTFDCACLVGFSMDYEDAMILNMYWKDGAIESFPYRPGMKVKTAALTVATSLIARKQPIVCEDITSLFTDGSEEVRNFFMAQGVRSFFALPVMVYDAIGGMLVVEYYDRSDIAYSEDRLYFLKMIANVLGDAKKRILDEERLYNYAYFDEATQLANRNMLIRKLDQSIHDKKESGNIAVLHIELENLRIITDAYGHAIGERIVIQSAAILKQQFGECCYISRSGEAEFVVILSAVEKTGQIEECVQRLLDAFSRPISTETGIEALFVVLNIGISVYPDNGSDALALLKNANLAGYQAKSTNNKVVFYTEQLEHNIAETVLYTNRLFRSLKNEEFSLEFQPQISCNTGKAVGVEALLRWTTGGKRVSPGRFIPILEQTGLMYDVGLWVLEQALQEHNRLIAKGFPPLRFSINLSIVQFQAEDFLVDFTNIIEKSGVKPQYIELEITESLYSENPEVTLDAIYKLKELGVSIAIDDFGTGYSTLNRVKLVPFDRLKIDKEIIDYIDLERKLAPLTEIILLLAKTFNASVTAEGVETKEQADFLKSIGCDEIQGYYFSRPLPPEALEEFLKNE